MRQLLLATALAGFCLSAASAEAAVYAFSFDNVDGSVAGTVSGTVTLGDGDGVFAATALTIDAGPAALGYGYPITLADFVEIPANSFTVTGGAIDIASSGFFGIFPGYGNAFALHSDAGFAGTPEISFLDVSSGGFLGSPGVLDATSATLSFSAPPSSDVPAPAALPLAVAGLAALGFVGGARRRG